MLSGVIGVTLIQQPHFAQGNFASLVALASSVSTAVAMLGLHKLQGIDHRAVVVHFSGVSTLICGLTIPLHDPADVQRSLPGPGAVAMLLGVGAAATTGQLFLTRAFAAGPPARVSVVGLTQVVFALAIDVTILHEETDWRKWVGVALVIGPAAWLITSRAGGEPPA